MIFAPVDLLKLPKTTISQFVEQFTPGLLLLLVTSIGRPDLVRSVVEYPHAPIGITAAAAMIGAFVLGVLLTHLASIISFTLLLISSVFASRMEFLKTTEVSKEKIWRKLATNLLGPLIPLERPSSSLNEIERELKSLFNPLADQLKESKTSKETLNILKPVFEIAGKEIYLEGLDDDWQRLYCGIETNSKAHSMEASIPQINQVLAGGFAILLPIVFLKLFWSGFAVTIGIIFCVFGALNSMFVGMSYGASLLPDGHSVGLLLRLLNEQHTALAKARWATEEVPRGDQP